MIEICIGRTDTRFYVQVACIPIFNRISCRRTFEEGLPGYMVAACAPFLTSQAFEVGENATRISDQRFSFGSIQLRVELNVT